MDTHFCEYADAHSRLASLNDRANGCMTLLYARSGHQVDSVIDSVIDALVALDDLKDALAIIAEGALLCVYLATEVARSSVPDDIDYLAETARARLPLHVLADVDDRGARTVRRDMRRAVGRFGAVRPA
ncbi:hypothetical protein [Agromyces mariniharenae]|uniref:Uncharacterized protein n=1 Tax=Agromyces mariniharenae TaxID=2604423 RepID=A0A5S4UZM3_9MICO|nr:hypothetical protein [Agromyces mariniharenae]TYL51169.1 hypothetical protein FYC51_18810 [Agromyces mariniharenae]